MRKTITEAWLRRKRACCGGIYVFKDEFGASVSLRELLVKAAVFTLRDTKAKIGDAYNYGRYAWWVVSTAVDRGDLRRLHELDPGIPALDTACLENTERLWDYGRRQTRCLGVVFENADDIKDGQRYGDKCLALAIRVYNVLNPGTRIVSEDLPTGTCEVVRRVCRKRCRNA